MRSIPYGQWPKRTLPFGESAGGKVHRGFDLHKVVSPRAKATLAKSIESFKATDVPWSRFLTDCAAAVLSRLGDVYNPPREMVAALPLSDRLFVLFESLVEHEPLFRPVGFCGNPLCNEGRGTVITPPPVDLKVLPVNEPEPGDFELVNGRWMFRAEWPEVGIHAATLFLPTAAEEEEREKRNLSNATYPAGDFWYLSQVVADLNGEGPLTEAQLERGRRFGMVDPRRVGTPEEQPDAQAFNEDLPRALLRLVRDPLGGPPLGVDLRLDLECPNCGTINENAGRVDLAQRFFGVSDLKGSPRTKLRLTSSSSSPPPTPSA